MARISVFMANNWAKKYVIAASATGSSSQNETCAGFRTASAWLLGTGRPSAGRADSSPAGITTLTVLQQQQSAIIDFRQVGFNRR
jgi:hypothetical protein